MNLIDYRKKLGLSFCDEDKVRLFLNKAYMAFSEAIQIDTTITPEEYNQYCFDTGIKVEPICFSPFADDGYKVFQHLMKATDDFKKFLYYYTIFLNSSKKDSPERKSWISAFNYWAVQSELEFEFYESEEKVFIFTKGAKEMDDALVSEPLEWLIEYPQTRKEWIDALKAYSNLTDDNASDVADKFRKALERFFQEFFEKNQSLENLKSEYGKYMKAQGIPPEISNNFESLHQSYTNFMNGYAKHHDKTSKNVLEYIMYQTGNIIRLLITLKKGENT